jgi:hypothetical protein
VLASSFCLLACVHIACTNAGVGCRSTKRLREQQSQSHRAHTWTRRQLHCVWRRRCDSTLSGARGGVISSAVADALGRLAAAPSPPARTARGRGDTSIVCCAGAAAARHLAFVTVSSSSPSLRPQQRCGRRAAASASSAITAGAHCTWAWRQLHRVWRRLCGGAPSGARPSLHRWRARECGDYLTVSRAGAAAAHWSVPAAALSVWPPHPQHRCRSCASAFDGSAFTAGAHVSVATTSACLAPLRRRTCLCE